LDSLGQRQQSHRRGAIVSGTSSRVNPRPSSVDRVSLNVAWWPLRRTIAGRRSDVFGAPKIAVPRNPSDRRPRTGGTGRDSSTLSRVGIGHRRGARSCESPSACGLGADAPSVSSTSLSVRSDSRRIPCYVRLPQHARVADGTHERGIRSRLPNTQRSVRTAQSWSRCTGRSSASESFSTAEKTVDGSARP